MKSVIKRIIGKNISRKLSMFRYKFYNFLCSFLPMKNEILMESHPDFSCNTFELYRYMLKMGLNNKMHILWRVENPEKYLNKLPHNVSCIDYYPKTRIEKIKNYLRCNRAKISVSCNRSLQRFKVSKRQLNIYLDHGSQLKNLNKNYVNEKYPDCGYYVSQSSFFVPYNIEQYNLNENQIVCLGLARNDQLFRHYDSLHKLLSREFSKIVLWVPTFREHKNKKRIDVDSNFPFGFPLLYSDNDIILLDNLLKKHNVLLIVKPHPAQDVSCLQALSSDYIKILYNDELQNASIQTNELLAQVDAMITDYSSIYYDFLICDKPLALTLDDYEKYKVQKGFVFNDPLEVLVGEYLYKIDDLLTFIDNVVYGNDIKKDERNRIKTKINDYLDDKSSERLYDFILSEYSKRWGPI